MFACMLKGHNLYSSFFHKNDILEQMRIAAFERL
jgi:hypothetical protein